MITLSQMKGKKGKCRAHDPSKCRFHAGCHKENGGESEFEFPSWIDEDVFPMENWKRYFDLALPHLNAIRNLNKEGKSFKEEMLKRHIGEMAKNIGVLFGLEKEKSHIGIGKCDFHGNKEVEDNFARAISFYEKLCHQSIISKTPINFSFEKENDDSYFEPISGTCVVNNNSFHEILHEIAHYIEFNNNPLRHSCEQYLDSRCGDEESHIILVNDDGEKIFGREDKFAHPYSGRDYIVKPFEGKNTPTLRVMTEILSTGIQYATYEPFTFYKEDKDHFAFTVFSLQGEILL